MALKQVRDAMSSTSSSTTWRDSVGAGEGAAGAPNTGASGAVPGVGAAAAAGAGVPPEVDKDVGVSLLLGSLAGLKKEVAALRDAKQQVRAAAGVCALLLCVRCSCVCACGCACV